MRHEARGLTRQNEVNLAARAFHGNSRSTGAAGQRLLASFLPCLLPSRGNRPYFNDRLLIHPDFDLLRDMRVG
jgi:hypothetical protein